MLSKETWSKMIERISKASHTGIQRKIRVDLNGGRVKPMNLAIVMCYEKYVSVMLKADTNTEEMLKKLVM